VSGFLDEMARSSRARVALAKRREPQAMIEQRAASAPPAPPLRLSAAGFDVIAEIKLRSPAAGRLLLAGDDWLGRACAYGRAGAAAVSVLTEPSQFDGSPLHLERAAAALAPLGVPAMCKDFLVDPYQLSQARALGAGGALIILRMLSRAQASEMLDAACRHGLFVMLEAFDAAELAQAGELAAQYHDRAHGVLIGLNCRDLQTLKVVPQRFFDLAGSLPPSSPVVAESGVAAPEEAAALRKLGYRLALVGSALMASEDPCRLIANILRAART